MLQRAASNAYSWWWASHIRTKQSKWLDQSLQDMKEKVEYIIKIIEEDGDSFAQRAEMYYRKRPELLNFVEVSFREYRALAERYDHLSRELQTANRTIATVCPEQVQLAMDDEDETLSSSSTHSSDNQKPSKNFPAAPKLDIPEKNDNKGSKEKRPSRLMSKKGLLKFNVPNSDADTKSGMMKEEALGKIDEFQKMILGLQTEKQFVQSLYENGLAKYWEIENKIIEMQNNVNNLEDEFGIATFIEDDEARTLMATTALKTCQEALARLQDKQKQSEQEAIWECERIKQIHEKLVLLKEGLGNQTKKDALHEKLEVDEKLDNVEKNQNDLGILTDKENEQKQANTSISFTMFEIAEKIDDLVEKVITLETALSSQDALVMRLRLQTCDLQAQMKIIEQNKNALINGFNGKNDKIVELKQELIRIKNLKQCFENENKNLWRRFTEASFTIDHLFEKLKTVKQHEEVESTTPREELINNPAGAEVNTIDLREDLASTDIISKILNMDYIASVSGEEEKLGVPVNKPEMEIEFMDVTTAPVQISKSLDDWVAFQNTTMTVENNDLMQSNSNSPINSFPESAEIQFPNNNTRIWLHDYQGMISRDHDLEISKIMGIEDLFETDDVYNQTEMIKDKENLVHADPNSSFDALFMNAPAIFNPREHAKQEKLGSDTNNLDSRDIHKMTDQSLFIYNPFDCNEGFKEHEVEQTHANNIAASENGKLGKGEIYENYDLKLNWSNPFDNLLTETQTAGAGEVISQGLNKEHRIAKKINNDGMFSKETMLKEKMNEDPIASVPVRGEECFDQINSNNPLERLPKGKTSKEDGDIMAPGGDKTISEYGKEVEEVISSEVPDGISMVKAQAHEKQIESDSSAHVNFSQKEDYYQSALSKELQNEEDETPNWKEILQNGLEGREKVMLQKYTATLRNYKETKKQLDEMEKKTHDSLFKSEFQIKELKNANASKDAEIQSLHRKLDLLQVCLDENPETSPANSSNQQGIKEDKTLQKQASDLLDEQKLELVHKTEEKEGTEQIPTSPEKGKQGPKRVVFTTKPDANLTVEEKFRSDIDGLLEENIEFWLRFSTLFQQIQNFQTSVEDLHDELLKPGEMKRQTSKQNYSSNSDIRLIYNRLREIQTELTLWLDHNALLEFDLQHRLASLSRLQGEISSVSTAENKVQENWMNNYQAAKFQGEIQNMKQENHQVAQKLQLGFERVKELQSEISKTISNLGEQLEFSATKKQRSTGSSSSRSKIPLRSFLFGVKLKKRRPSLFHCMDPALQKQYSDLHSVQT